MIPTKQFNLPADDLGIAFTYGPGKRPQVAEVSPDSPLFETVKEGDIVLSFESGSAVYENLSLPMLVEMIKSSSSSPFRKLTVVEAGSGDMDMDYAAQSVKVGPCRLPSGDSMDLEDHGIIFEPSGSYRVKIKITPGSWADMDAEWKDVQDGMLLKRITSSTGQDYSDPDMDETNEVINGVGQARDCWFEDIDMGYAVQKGITGRLRP